MPKNKAVKVLFDRAHAINKEITALRKERAEVMKAITVLQEAEAPATANAETPEEGLVASGGWYAPTDKTPGRPFGGAISADNLVSDATTPIPGVAEALTTISNKIRGVVSEEKKCECSYCKRAK